MHRYTLSRLPKFTDN